jgi:CO/xanthine dehydrogenase Mo-binding subunit
MSEQSQIGRSIPRLDSVEKVTGKGLFAADIQLPGMLFAKFLASPHPHAEILSIDTSAAELLPGVRAVVTAADIPAEVEYYPEWRAHAFLARGHVVFAGQPVAAVAADDLATAEAAVELIQVEYRPLTVVATLEQALETDCPAVRHGLHHIEHAESGHTGDISAGEEADLEDEKSPNVVADMVFSFGDVEAAFAASDVIVENTYTVPVVHQGHIEPQGVTAYWDRPDHVTVWACVQGAWGARGNITNVLGIRQTNITFNATEIGGGFGAKFDGLYSPIAVLLAKKAEQPVQLILTREEELTCANPAPRTVIRIKTGARADGTFTAVEADVLFDAGAFQTGWMTNLLTATLRDNYRFEAWHMRGREILTNKASVGAYRAPGMPNSHFAMESQVDEIAHVLNIDPLEIRQKNVIREGDMRSNKEPQDPVGAKAVLEAVAGHPAWTSQLQGAKNGRLHGRGISLGGWAGATGPASAIAYLEADGRFRIVLGTVDLTGSYTGLAQIAAEALGVSLDKIEMSKTNPDHAPYAPPSGGSQTIYAMGAAVFDAACDLRNQLISYVARSLDVREAALDVDNGGIYLKAQPGEKQAFNHLYKLGTGWANNTGPFIGTGSARERQRAPGYAACVAEVDVESRTGKISLSRLTIFQDVGKAINPLLVEGQMQGAGAQSAAIALWEELAYDDEGQVQNRSLLDYRMPTAADMPPIETVIIEAPGGNGPFGAKLVGEPSMAVPVAAVANAVANAIGSRIYDLPITPERIWQILQEDTRSKS